MTSKIHNPHFHEIRAAFNGANWLASVNNCKYTVYYKRYREHLFAMKAETDRNHLMVLDAIHSYMAGDDDKIRVEIERVSRGLLPHLYDEVDRLVNGILEVEANYDEGQYTETEMIEKVWKYINALKPIMYDECANWIFLKRELLKLYR